MVAGRAAWHGGTGPPDRGLGGVAEAGQARALAGRGRRREALRPNENLPPLALTTGRIDHNALRLDPRVTLPGDLAGPLDVYEA